jgi:hypothetical protein
MSALKRIKKVKGGYEITVSCTNKPTLTAFYRTYEQCNVFADEYFLDYLGVALKSVHRPVGDGIEPEGIDPESLETAEIEIPRDFTKENGWVHGMVMACKQNPNNADINVVALYHVIDLIRQDEREACAALCEEASLYFEDDQASASYAADYCADEIRKRNEK